MSITLDYSSIGPVPDPVAAEIATASKALLSRDWWVDPLVIVQNRSTKRLGGTSKIGLGTYGFIVVPEAEEAVMVCREAGFIVTTLTRWSQDYKVSWSLNAGSTRIGDIVDGKPSSGVSGYAQRICADLKLPITNVPEILKKHAYRKD